MDIKRVEFGDRLTDKQIADLIDNYIDSGEQGKAIERDKYALGSNCAIMARKSPDPSAPDNKVPISYARKIVNTIVGYMYKPGLIRYASEDETYLKSLTEIFDANEEPIKSAQLGKQTSIHGVGYEYHYIDGQPTEEGVVAVPRFAMLPVSEVVPVYDAGVEPKLRAFVRFYDNGGNDGMAEVYYDQAWYKYARRRDGGKTQLTPLESGTHPYNKVPLNVYWNNDEGLGDFVPVKALIDAYDVLASDSMNEFDRFAWAYLVLKGFKMSDEDAEDIKYKRAFSLFGEKDAVEFLTKDINSDFIKFMAEWFRGEIHAQSGIPDVADIKFGSAASGTTIDKFIYLMELFTDPKEALFRAALRRRIELISGVLAVRDGAKPADVEITMTRNLPTDNFKNAETLEKYSGHVTEKTLLKEFAPFVKDVDKELKEMAKEKETELEAMQKEFEMRAAAQPDEDKEEKPQGRVNAFAK